MPPSPSRTAIDNDRIAITTSMSTSKPSLKAKLESVLNPNNLFRANPSSRSPSRSRSAHPGQPQLTPGSLPVSHLTSDLNPSSNKAHHDAPESLSVPADASISAPPIQPSIPRAALQLPAGVSPESGTPDPNSLSNMAAVGFNGFKTVLRLIERGTDVFPPLKSTAACLLGLIDLVENTRQNPEDSAELEQHLSGIVNILKLNHSASPSSRISLRLDGLSTAIKHQMLFLQSKRSHGIFRRAAEVTKDAGDISACYRTISVLADRFLMETTLTVEDISQQNLDHTLLSSIPRAQYAAYDAYGPARRNGCTENTRAAILARMMAWATTLSTTSIYWLNGMAGTGKTTISYSFSSLLECFGLLGATFFCSRRDDDCTKVNHIIPTIVYQLALRFPAVLESLPDLLKRHPDVGNKTITRQFNDWLVPVLTSASAELPIHTSASGEHSKRPIIVAIDGLDECSDQKDVQVFLSKIAQLPLNLPVKFFVTSRPEQTLRKEFSRSAYSSLERFNLHDIEADIVQDDIRLYVKQRLHDISDGRSELQGSTDTWPPEDEVSALVRQAGKLFIYAATACEYIDKRGDIRDRLTTVANTPAEAGMNQLDGLYKHILATAYENASVREKDDMVLVLRAVTSAPIALSAQSISLLLNISIDRVWTALASLHSVIYMPPSRDAHAIISTFHASFSDYLTDQERSGELFLNASESHHEMALHCLSVMNSELRRNICCLEGRPKNVDILPSIVQECTSDALTFSCVYWTTHVKLAWYIHDNDNLHEQLELFFSNHNLHWIEYLSLIGRLEVAVNSLTELERWAQHHHPFLPIIFDTRRLVVENFDLIKHYCLEIYHSALIWLPAESLIRARYTEQGHDLPRVLAGLQRSWAACELILQCQGAVNSVVFSPDCSRVASASDMNTVQIWNAATGDLETILEGHIESVDSVMFTPDGSHIVSASKDNTMRLWDIATSDSQVVFTGNVTNGAMPIVFSPDAGRMASISTDKTVRIWNTAIVGESEIILAGHTDLIESIAFSPDSRRIASASADGTVRIWNVATGDPETFFTGHTDRVTSVVFSSDSTRIASASADSTVRIWNTAIRELEATLVGHINSVTSFMFIPDGSLVASASTDGTVLLWNAATGDLVATLMGHIKCVKSIVLSPDRSRIVSTSEDKTVRIWSTITSQLQAVIKEHSNHVHTVIFSPDGSCVVSGSDTDTSSNYDPGGKVLIWNVLTSHLEADLEVNRGRPNSVDFSADNSCIIILWDHNALIWNRESKSALRDMVKAFSPDNVHFVSGSYGSNVMRLWNRATCNLEAVLKGHSTAVQNNRVMFSPDCSHITCTTGDKTVWIWNARTGDLGAVLEGRTSRIWDVAFSPDCSRIACMSKEITVWDVATGKPKVILEDPKDSLCVEFSPDGSRIAGICVDYDDFRTLHTLVQIWNSGTGKSEIIFRGHTSQITSVAFSPNGGCIASASTDTTVRIWNIATGTLEAILNHFGKVSSVVFSLDGRRIASASGEVRIWNAATGTLEAILDSDKHVSHSVVFSLDGRHVVSTSQYVKSMLLLDIATGNSETVHHGAILPDGSQVWLADQHRIRVRQPAVSVGVNQRKAVPDAVPISVSGDRKWVVRAGDSRFCSISPSYRNFTTVACLGSLVCMGFQSGRVVILDTGPEKHLL